MWVRWGYNVVDMNVMENFKLIIGIRSLGVDDFVGVLGFCLYALESTCDLNREGEILLEEGFCETTAVIFVCLTLAELETHVFLQF